MNTAYIFIGRSGAGKGTQVALLAQKAAMFHPGTPPFVVETGKKFRELIATGSHTARLVQAITGMGKLPPAFIGVHMWSHGLMEGYAGQGPVFIDGSPRMVDEVPLLLGAIEFYNLRAEVINLCVSDEWAYDHIKIRGRADDVNDEEVWERIKWYHQSVEPSIELLRQSPLVTVHDIYGEQTIEEVHRAICEATGV